MNDSLAQAVSTVNALEFDSVKRIDVNGYEFWLARDLMPMLGYDRWENFQESIRRAMQTAMNQNQPVEDLFRGVTKKGAGRPQKDFELARYACYLVAMNGDPRKPEVAAAQSYFAIQTRMAETQLPAQLSEEEIVNQALQITARKVRELESKIEADAPKVEYMDTHVAVNDVHLFRAVASNLNVTEGDLRWALVYSGWIYHDSQRRRTSKGELVTEHLWSEYAHKKRFFHRVMNHEAPLFKGAVYYTLKITTEGSAAITGLVHRIEAQHGSLRAALPVLEAEYRAKLAKRKAS